MKRVVYLFLSSALVSCKPTTSSTIKSWFGIEAGQNSEVRKADAEIFRKLSDWFQLFKVRAVGERSSGYKTSVNDLASRLPASYLKGLSAYLQQQLARHDEFVQALNRDDDARLVQLLDAETREMKAIALALFVNSCPERPETPDLFVSLICKSRRTSPGFTDRFSAKGFLIPLLQQYGSFYNLANDIERQRLNYLEALKKQMVGNSEAKANMTQHLKSTQQAMLAMLAQINQPTSGGSGLSLLGARDSELAAEISGVIAALPALLSNGYDQGMNQAQKRPVFAPPGQTPYPSSSPGALSVNDSSAGAVNPESEEKNAPFFDLAGDAKPREADVVQTNSDVLDPKAVQQQRQASNIKPQQSFSPSRPTKPNSFNSSPNGGNGNSGGRRPNPIGPSNPFNGDGLESTGPGGDMWADGAIYDDQQAAIDNFAPDWGNEAPQMELTGGNSKSLPPVPLAKPKFDCSTLGLNDYALVICARYGAFVGVEPAKTQKPPRKKGFALNPTLLSQPFKSTYIVNHFINGKSLERGGDVSAQMTGSCTQHATQTVARIRARQRGIDPDQIFPTSSEQVERVFAEQQGGQPIVEAALETAQNMYRDRLKIDYRMLNDPSEVIDRVKNKGRPVYTVLNIRMDGGQGSWLNAGRSSSNFMGLTDTEDADPFGVLADHSAVSNGYGLNDQNGLPIVGCTGGGQSRHAVATVGVEVGNSVEDSYLIIKNSWSPEWGNDSTAKVPLAECADSADFYDLTVDPR